MSFSFSFFICRFSYGFGFQTLELYSVFFPLAGKKSSQFLSGLGSLFLYHSHSPEAVGGAPRAGIKQDSKENPP